MIFCSFDFFFNQYLVKPKPKWVKHMIDWLIGPASQWPNYITIMNHPYFINLTMLGDMQKCLLRQPMRQPLSQGSWQWATWWLWWSWLGNLHWISPSSGWHSASTKKLLQVADRDASTKGLLSPSTSQMLRVLCLLASQRSRSLCLLALQASSSLHLQTKPKPYVSHKVLFVDKVLLEVKDVTSDSDPCLIHVHTSATPCLSPSLYQSPFPSLCLTPCSLLCLSPRACLCLGHHYATGLWWRITPFAGAHSPVMGRHPGLFSTDTTCIINSANLRICRKYQMGFYACLWRWALELEEFYHGSPWTHLVSQRALRYTTCWHYYVPLLWVTFCLLSCLKIGW